MNALADNDVLFKGACYGLLSDLISVVCAKGDVAGLLGAARYVVPKKIQRAKLKGSADQALRVFSKFLERATVLEPTDGEQQLAADLELAAQKLHLSLDSGESQLCAVLVSRLVPFLLTGDKRAIQAMEALIDGNSRLSAMCGKIKCLEQLVAGALLQGNPLDVRSAVCGEPEIDKALAICFSCKDPMASAATFTQGLQSYISDLRERAGRVLAP